MCLCVCLCVFVCVSVSVCVYLLKRSKTCTLCGDLSHDLHDCISLHCHQQIFLLDVQLNLTIVRVCVFVRVSAQNGHLQDVEVFDQVWCPSEFLCM